MVRLWRRPHPKWYVSKPVSRSKWYVLNTVIASGKSQSKPMATTTHDNHDNHNQWHPFGQQARRALARMGFRAGAPVGVRVGRVRAGARPPRGVGVNDIYTVLNGYLYSICDMAFDLVLNGLTWFLTTLSHSRTNQIHNKCHISQLVHK